MTREEAIKIINCYDIGFYDLSREKIPANKLADALDMAIEALSADTIIRKDTVTLNSPITISAVQGEWIRKEKEINDCDGHRAYYWHECSVCGARPPKDTWKNEWHSDFCPSCGARMRGGTE